MVFLSLFYTIYIREPPAERAPDRNTAMKNAPRKRSALERPRIRGAVLRSAICKKRPVLESPRIRGALCKRCRAQKTPHTRSTALKKCPPLFRFAARSAEVLLRTGFGGRLGGRRCGRVKILRGLGVARGGGGWGRDKTYRPHGKKVDIFPTDEYNLCHEVLSEKTCRLSHL